MDELYQEKIIPKKFKKDRTFSFLFRKRIAMLKPKKVSL